MTAFLQDLRYALRMYGKDPLFAASAIMILALGLGLNAATFSLFDAVVLRSLPGVESPSELVIVEAQRASYPSFLDFRRDGSHLFRGVAAWSERWLSVSEGSSAQRLRGLLVSADYFDVLGVRPAAGRFFRAREEDSGEAIAVVSNAFAVSRFGQAPFALGRTFLANGVPFTIVGVAPGAFRGVAFASRSDAFIPIGTWPRIATGGLARLDLHGRSWGWLSMFARLPRNVPISTARAAVAAIGKREAAAFPDSVGADGIGLRPLGESAAGAGTGLAPARFLGILVAAVGVVLLIACANLANLLLARGASRRRELAVRQALGASRPRVVRQLLTEALVLAAAGGGAGLLLASWLVSFIGKVPLPGGGTFDVFDISLDVRVLAYGLLLTLATGALFGFVPAWQGSRSRIASSLKQSPAGGRFGVNGALLSTQVALCLLLLTGAGLFVRSLRNALSTDLGFRTRGVALASVNLGLARYDPVRARRFAADLARRAESLPGVQSVAWTGIVPLSGEQNVETFKIPGATRPLPSEVDVAAVGARYFETLGIPLLAGREFNDRVDRRGGVPAVVVNEAAARRFWPGQSALGRRIDIFGGEHFVVGVARGWRSQSFEEAGLPIVVVCADQLGPDAFLSTITLAVRTSGDARLALEPIRREIASLDSTLPVFELRTLEDSIGDMLLPQRLGSGLLGVFAVLAFLLAEVGIYAVIAGHVARRVRELGVRLALGARPGQIRRMVLRQTAVPIAVGAGAGLVLSFGAGRLVARFLYGVTPADPLTFAAVLSLLLAGGLAAADLPARRAARIDPMQALRTE